ncbi:hypothetical protein GCM10023403_26830 [Pseudonocardia benzenivorans]|uniref:Integral membrane protein n=1 Tax=Pseudonocardia dioxanivorans (strain ATCC 55486 / DSM 44775 / JCM 13855 / CB1190) TaxID=675635 RepID=F4CU88_PSEUX|nr:hypothetical protein Psed_1935 [Pseudonocardia dioxanivorans CB1190]
MEFLRLVLLFLHFIGLAVLLGAFVAQLREPAVEGRRRPATGMLHGALTQLVTGVALVGLREGALDLPVDNTKIAVKLGVVVVLLALVIVGRRKTLGPAAFWAIGGLAVLNVGIAVFWV